MKKHLIIAGLAMIILSACGRQETVVTPSPTAAAPGQRGTQNAGTVNNAYITEEQAKETAFTHAKVQEETVSLLRVQFDYDDMRAIYEVDFYSDNNEYDYDIDAVTGEILGFDTDRVFSYSNQAQTTQADGAVQGNTSADNTTQGNTSADSTVQGNTSADSTTQGNSAVGGTAQSNQTSGGSTQGNSTPGNTAGNPVSAYEFITDEEAENAALTHAGLSSADVSFLRSHLDRDDGRTLYEVSFYYNFTEYEYDIDAVTGNILSYDQDYGD
jgi:uncharacterized membrane protein YkoI